MSHHWLLTEESPGKVEAFLRRNIPHKELGHQNYGEKFTRWTLFRCRWFTVYLHKLDGPIVLPYCHDHPWPFWVFILIGGYWEWIRGRWHRREPGNVFYRPAASFHNTLTDHGRPNWSIVIVGRKRHQWSFRGCQG